MRKIIYLFVVGFLLGLAGCATSSHQQSMKSPQIDRISEAELARIMPAPVATLSLDEVVKLSQAGNSVEQIIDKIKASNSLYDLTPSQSIALSQQGVDSQVLDYMHASRELALRNSIADEINKRGKEKREALEKLKRQQLLQQQRFYDPFCRGYYGFYPYGYGAYGSRFGPHFGLGAGYARPWGCW
ncbi:MAG: hypothetical protein Q7T58_01270 [Methylotenera sp.]|nr:hypothetical protein [Methylotenera sp.]